MKRWLFNILAVVSLIMCAVVIVLWIRSHLVLDSVLWQSGKPSAWSANQEIHSAHGGIGWICQSHHFEGPQLPNGVTVEHVSQWPNGWYREGPSVWDGVVGSSWLNRRGFYFTWERRESATYQSLTSVDFRRAIGVPYWLLFILTATPLVLRLAHGRRRRQLLRTLGICCSCGYDLTGNVSGVCPECGTAIPARAGTQNDCVSCQQQHGNK